MPEKQRYVTLRRRGSSFAAALRVLLFKVPRVVKGKLDQATTFLSITLQGCIGKM
jgi:hypothetical protein